MKITQKEFFHSDTTVAVHITNKCNMRCPYCYQQRFGGYDGIMDKERVYDAIKNISPKTILCFGGEPMLYPQMILDIMNDFPQCDVGVITNGTIWNKEIFDRSVVIMVTLESFFFDFAPENRKYTKNQWDNVQNLIETYKDKVLIMHNIYPKHNDPYFAKIAALGEFMWQTYPIISYDEDAEYDVKALMQYNVNMDIFDTPKLRILMDGTLSKDMRQKYNLHSYKEFSDQDINAKVPLHDKCKSCCYADTCPGVKMFPHFCKDVLDEPSIKDPHFCKVARWIKNLYHDNERQPET